MKQTDAEKSRVACSRHKSLSSIFHFNDCIEDCTSVSSSEGDTIRVGALLDCIKGCNSL